MTDVNNETNETIELDSSEVEQEVTLTLEEALIQINELKAGTIKDKELVKTIRKYEAEQKKAKEVALVEQGKWKELYEDAADKLSKVDQERIENKITKAIQEVVKDSGTKAPETLTRLLQTYKTEMTLLEDGAIDINFLKQQIKLIQKSDPILFELPNVETPDIKKSSADGNAKSFETEIKLAKTQSEVNAVMAKYSI